MKNLIVALLLLSPISASAANFPAVFCHESNQTHSKTAEGLNRKIDDFIRRHNINKGSVMFSKPTLDKYIVDIGDRDNKTIIKNGTLLNCFPFKLEIC